MIIFLEPVFKERPWGGRKLKEEWGYDIPDGKIGECWAISAHPNGDCMVSSGEFRGMRLSELWDTHRELFGNRKGDRFPLLVKILDADEDLSLQVHPDDAYAAEHEEGSLGKKECWYVLDAPEGAALVIGHNAKTKEELTSMIREERWEDLIREIPVKKGDFVQIDPGTIHAIKGGLEVLETQENSDITYRVYDYDRLFGGEKRPLHLDKSIDVITVPSPPPDDFIQDASRLGINYFCKMRSNEIYTVWKLTVTEPFTFRQSEDFMLMSVVDGEGLINGQPISKGMHFILPCDSGLVGLSGNMTIIASAPGQREIS